MTKHDPFWKTGRTRSIDNGHQFFGLDGIGDVFDGRIFFFYEIAVIEPFLTGFKVNGYDLVFTIKNGSRYLFSEVTTASKYGFYIGIFKNIGVLPIADGSI